MADPRDVILRPVITEKSNDAMAEGKYSFWVDPRSNKSQIKQAVEDLFGVTVLNVNTMKRPGKARRRGWVVGRTSARKKAIITLRPGEKIDFFEGF